MRPASASPCSTATSATITRAELVCATNVVCEARRLDLDRDGARRHDEAALSVLGRLRAIVDEFPRDRAGSRIAAAPELRPFLPRDGPIGVLAAAVLGQGCRPVRAILFNKNEELNWALGWHQDRTICVREQCDVPGFGPWTVKDGLNHVEPPFGLLARMVTLRIHLDDVSEDNAPLLIAPGSHRLGRVSETKIDAAVRQCGTLACTARAGDVWLYATPILHASERARRPASRRVLQVDYSADELPHALAWMEI